MRLKRLPNAGPPRHRGAIFWSMLTVRARVKNGRLVLDEPTDLPEGTEVELEAIADDLDADDRKRLHTALDAADDELRAGKGIPGHTVLAAIRRSSWSSRHAQVLR
jgi:hypothetical protein